MQRRRRTGAAVGLLAVLLALGCGSTLPAAGPSDGAPVPVPVPISATPRAGGGPGVGPVPTSTPAADPPSADFPTPHPAFARHFADPIYHDESDEFAPFGSDEGWDTLYSWAEHPEDLDRCTTVRSMYDEEDGDLAAALEQAPDVGPDVDGAIIGVGFTLLFFTGHIDPEGKQVVLDAIRREARYYDDETFAEFPVLLRDLEAFEASSCGTSG